MNVCKLSEKRDGGLLILICCCAAVLKSFIDSVNTGFLGSFSTASSIAAIVYAALVNINAIPSGGGMFFSSLYKSNQATLKPSMIDPLPTLIVPTKSVLYRKDSDASSLSS